MKKIVLLMYLIGLSVFAQAQTFQKYLALFPDITQDVAWTGADLEKKRVEGNNISPEYRKFIDDTGVGHDHSFPMGKLEIGGTIIVFYAEHSLGYKENYDTQFSIHARAYNKKGEIISGGIQNYLATTGGVPDRFTYSFKLNLNLKDKKLVVDQKATDAEMQNKTTYSLSKKGIRFENKE